ncbi:MAG: (Fe-S)-binding protein [Syntrophomonadaceae bacterium]|jgi:Fe-S oxidoreductase/nitrate reductase gamma subunit|nr:(Fe-S)-binding protein [Syntrophomonadaceae bacterium]
MMIFGFEPFKGAYEVAERVVGANVPYEWLIYFIMFIPIIIFLYGAWKRIEIWTLGEGKINRFDKIWVRLVSWFTFSFAQARVIRKPVAGWMHALLFWGFLVLAAAAGVDAAHYWTGFPPIIGNAYIVFSCIVDIMGLLALLGIIALFYIRYIMKPERLNDTKPEDGLMILLIFIILVSGFFLEALRIHVQILLAPTAETHLAVAADYERFASPVGWVCAKLFSWMSMGAAEMSHRILWWFHMAVSFLFIALVPFTKLWHIVAGMCNYAFRDLGPSALRMVDNIEEAENFGVERVEEFSWKDILDLDACIRCGRCQENCPAYNTGKALNPKITIIQNMKAHMYAKAPYLLEAKKLSADGETSVTALEGAAAAVMDSSLIYDVVTAEAVWDCTNCRACMEHCPMFIEHIPKIIEMRRNLVMWQGDMPSEAQAAFTNMERNYNPWGVGWALRSGWLEERGVRDIVNLLPEDGGDFEYLFYAGCAVSFDDRYKRVGEALIRLLHKAGVSVGYLGTEEYCCGDSARRLGNEYLFQTLAAQNIESFNNYGVKKIIVVCPHGYNTLKNEYPQLGGQYEVYHYTEILAELIEKGKLQVTTPINSRITYHDSCFLGRHNGIYQQPRSVLKACGTSLVEVEKSKEFGFCCGAGGGRMWLEEEAAEGHKRINDTRTSQLLVPEPEMIVTNCPFCLTMISDGVKGTDQGETVKVFDVAEVLWKAVG